MIGWSHGDPEERLESATDLFHQGRVAAARAELETLAEQGYRCADVYLYLGHCALAEDEIGEALAHYREARRRDRDRTDVLVGLAIVAARRLNFARAVRLLKRAVRAEPDLCEAWDNLILCHAATSDHTAAERAFQRSVQVDETSPHPYYNAGFLYFDQGEVTRAREMWSTVRRLKRDYPDIDRLLANCDRVLGNIEGARRRLERLVRREPRNPDALADLALVHEERDEWQSASKMCERALDADPNLTRVRARLGILYFRHGRKSDGLEHLCRAHGEDPSDPAIVEPYSFALLESGQPDEAFSVARRAVRAAPDEAESHMARGHVYAMARRFPRAAAAARRAWRCDPEAVEHGYDLVQALVRGDRAVPAREVLSDLQQTDGDIARPFQMLADLELREGDARAARTAAEHGLRRHPTDSGLMLRLAEASLRLGSPERALELAAHCEQDEDVGEGVRNRSMDITGRAWIVLGDYDQAGATARRLLAADESDPRGWALRGRAALLAGRSEEAAPDLRRYVRARPDDPGGYRDLARCLNEMGEEEAAGVQSRLGDYISRCAAAVNPPGAGTGVDALMEVGPEYESDSDAGTCL